MGDLDTLVEFGFAKEKAQRALKATRNSGLQPALDWLESHPGDNDGEELDNQDDQDVDMTKGAPAEDAKVRYRYLRTSFSAD
jgi:uncharacterized UBP type Zn finger protein